MKLADANFQYIEIKPDGTFHLCFSFNSEVEAIAALNEVVEDSESDYGDEDREEDLWGDMYGTTIP